MKEEKNKPTMCEMAGDKEMFPVLKEAARNARYVCSSCGRVAEQKDRLCRPEDLYGNKECGDGSCCR